MASSGSISRFAACPICRLAEALFKYDLGPLTDLDIRVRLYNLDVVTEVDWAVAVDRHALELFKSLQAYLGVCFAHTQVLAHVDVGREEGVLLGIDNRERMDRNEDLVSFAVNSNRVVEVLLFIVWSKLDVDVLGDTGGHHAFLVVLDFEVRRLRGQNVQPLWRGRVVDQADPHGVSLEGLKASELDDAGAGPKDAVRAHVVVDV